MDNGSQALHHKHRPKTFDEVLGNKEGIAMSESLLSREFDAIPRSWLFVGESGTGKTTMIRIIKDMLGCSDADYHEYNSANTRGIDSIREIASNSRLSAMQGTVKVYLLDEFHQVTGPAMQAALKMLEDAPPSTFFFLGTTNPEKLPKAIKTRCTTIKMKTLPYKMISTYLGELAVKEGIEGYPPTLCTAIAKASQGSCREAVKILDQIIDIEDDDLAMSAIESSLGDESGIDELCRALLGNSKWSTVASILKTMDMDAETARMVILKWFTKVLLSKGEDKVAEMIDIFKENYYDSGRAGLVVDCYLANKLH